MSKRDKIVDLVKKRLKEESATGTGASFTSGPTGENYATPVAGKAKNYYYKLGFKPVPDKIKGSGLQVKQLWEEDTLNEVNEFQQKRLDALDEIEKLMNEISPLISNAKNETIELYSGNAGSYDITKPIEMVKSYLQDIKQLLSEK
jgi:PHP family Zn ribbon phosphoesterase